MFQKVVVKKESDSGRHQDLLLFFLVRVLGKDNLPKDLIMCVINWRSSEASETLSGVTNGNWRYIYIWYVQDTLVARARWYVM